MPKKTETDDKRERTRAGYVRITDDVIEQICKEVADGGTTKDACALAECSYAYLEKCVTGEPADRPDWARCLTRARAEARRYWRRRLAKARKSAGVNAAKAMLSAIDPERFRENKYAVAGGAVQMLLMSPEVTEEARKMVSVIVASGKALPAGSE